MYMGLSCGHSVVGEASTSQTNEEPGFCNGVLVAVAVFVLIVFFPFSLICSLKVGVMLLFVHDNII